MMTPRKPPRSMMEKARGLHLPKYTALSIGILLGVTLYYTCILFLFNISYRVTTRHYRWYTIPEAQNCSTSPEELQNLVDLASTTARVLANLSIPSVACYGTLWGVLRRQEILPWDNNVDFCVMNEYLQNVSFSDLQQAFAIEGVDVRDLRFSKGSYLLKRRETIGHINVFYDCTRLFYLFHSEYGNDHNDVPTQFRGEYEHMACAFNLVSFVSRLYFDVNRPFPSWFLTPPFKTGLLGGVVVNVPHDSFEMQKYIYPDDWWMEARPAGCT